MTLYLITIHYLNEQHSSPEYFVTPQELERFSRWNVVADSAPAIILTHETGMVIVRKENLLFVEIAKP